MKSIVLRLRRWFIPSSLQYRTEFKFGLGGFLLAFIGTELFSIAGVLLAQKLIPSNSEWSHPILVYGIGTAIGLAMIYFGLRLMKTTKSKIDEKTKVNK